MLTITFLSILGLSLLFLGFSENISLTKGLATVGILGAIGLLLFGPQNLLVPTGMDTQLSFDSISIKFSTLILGFTFCIVLMSRTFISRESVQSAEFLAVTVFSVVGAIMLTSFTHMITLFVGLETFGISLYVLAGTDKRSAASNEASIKYLLMGAFATGLVLFGMAMLYGATGSLDFATIASSNNSGIDSVLFKTGIFFLLIGILFKVSAAPFHFWSPDVYEGSPNLVTLYMSVVVKIASFAALYRIFGNYFHSLSYFWWDVVYYCCMASLVIGNLLALVQKSLKRQMAFSSISHTGYLLFAILVVHNEMVVDGILFYLFSYGTAIMVSFSVLMSWFDGSENFQLDQLKGASKTDKTGSVLLTIAFLSMAGIPLTGGFFSKLFMFVPATADGLNHLLIVGILSSVVGAAYYFRPIMNVWFSTESPFIQNAAQIKWVALVGGVLILVTGLFPDTLISILALI
jgi:NADH-quinone oxidoreductase subunit N